MRLWKTCAALLFFTFLCTQCIAQQKPEMGTIGSKTFYSKEKLKTLTDEKPLTIPEFLNVSYDYGIWWGKHDFENHIADRTLTKRKATPKTQEGSLLEECFELSTEGLEIKVSKTGITTNMNIALIPLSTKIALGLLMIEPSTEEKLYEARNRFEDGYRVGYYSQRRAYWIGRITLGVTLVSLLSVVMILRMKYWKSR